MTLKNLSIILAAKEEGKNLVDILPRLKNYSLDQMKKIELKIF